MAINLGDLIVRLQGDSTGFEKMLDGATRKLQAAQKKMVQAGRKLTLAVTGPIAAMGAISVKAFADFDAAMTKSTAIMGNLSSSTRQAMEETAREISRNGVTSATDLAESYFFLASAGLSAEQSIASLAAVERFAVAGAFDMATATDLLTDAQSALGLVSNETEENLSNMIGLSDILLKANTLANASAQQFSEALVTKSAAALRLLNKDAAEGVAVLAAFADQGVKGAAAGEKLSIVLRDLQGASIKSTKAWDAMGLSVFDANGKMLPLADIIEQLETRFSGMTDEQKKASATMLGFQERSFSAIQTLFGTSEKIREYERELRKAGGITEEVANKQLKSFASQLKIVKNNITDAAISIGKVLAPVVVMIAEKIKVLTERWRALDDRTKKIVLIIAAVAAAIGPTLLAMGALAAAASTVAAFFTGAAGTVAVWIGVIGLVIGAIALVVDAILQMTGKGNLGILDLVNNFRIGGAKIKTWMQVAFVGVSEAWEDAKFAIITSFLSWKKTILDIGGAVVRSMSNFAQKVGSMWTKAIEKMKGGANAVKETAKGAALAVVNAAAAVIELQGEISNPEVLKKLRESLSPGGRTVGRTVSGGTGIAFIDKLAKKTDQQLDKFAAVEETIGKKASDSASVFTETIKSSFDAAESREKEYNATVFKLQKERQAKREAAAKKTADLFSKDAEEAAADARIRQIEGGGIPRETAFQKPAVPDVPSFDPSKILKDVDVEGILKRFGAGAEAETKKKIDVGSFQELSLSRFAIPRGGAGSRVSAAKKKQVTEAPKTDELLSELVDITKRNTPKFSIPVLR